MDALINLLVLYIIFTLFSSFVKKATSSKKKSEQTKEQRGNSGSQTVAPVVVQNSRLSRLTHEKAATLKRSGDSQQRQSTAPVKTVYDLQNHDPELERILHAPQEQMAEELSFKIPAPPQQHTPQQRESWVFPGQPEKSLIHGIVISEILAAPVGKRHKHLRRNA